MPVQDVVHVFNTDEPPVEIGVNLLGGPTGGVEFLYADIPGSSWTAPRIALAQQYVQDSMDTRIDRSTLPADHPYIIAGDPGLAWLFWDGSDVVERLVTFTELTFDGEHSTFRLTRLSRRTD